MVVRFLILLVILVAGFNTGCIESGGTTETGNSGQNIPAPDFDVPAAGPTATPAPVQELPPIPNNGTSDPITQNSGVEIERGNPIINKDTMDVVFFHFDWTSMKVSFNATCEGGEWEPFQATRTYPVAVMNGMNVITVRYADDGDIITPCYRASIRHDNMGPSILFKKYPAPVLEEGEAPIIEYEVTDASQITSTTCDLSGLKKACPAGGPHTVQLGALVAGEYSFSIEGADEAGNKSLEVVRWSVTSSARRLSQIFNVKDQSKVDILMIIDNSGSMEYEQKSMASRTANMLSIIRGLDWQIGITTTDPRSSKSYGDGNLVAMDGAFDTYVLDSSMSESQAQDMFSQTLQRSETGDSAEQGIRATYRVLEKNLKGFSPQHNRFIREGAHFAAVVITDEDESANKPENDPHNLMKLLSDNYPNKAFSFHSIITKPGDSACKSSYGKTEGKRYKTLSDLTGGVVGSVCATDYATQVSGIANGIRNLLKTLTLECAPLIDKPIHVYRDGVLYAGAYVVEGQNIKFTNELGVGSYKVEYSCLK